MKKSIALMFILSLIISLAGAGYAASYESKFYPENINGYVAYTKEKVAIPGKYFYYNSRERLIHFFLQDGEQVATSRTDDITHTKAGYSVTNYNITVNVDPGIYDLRIRVAYYNDTKEGWYYA